MNPQIAQMQTPAPNNLGNPSGGASTLTGGYNAALGSLQKSLKLLQGSGQSQQMMAQQQLSQNQGHVQQGLINSGLGNTTVAQTMQQAPLQTYNQQMTGIANNLAQQQSGVLGGAAGLQAKGAENMNQYQVMLQQLMAQQGAEQQKYAASKPGIMGMLGPGVG